MIQKIKNMLGIGPKVNLGELIANGATIIDVRTRGEYSSGHAKGSVNVPLDQFAEVDEKRPSPWGFPIDNELQIGVDRYPIPMNDVLFGFY